MACTGLAYLFINFSLKKLHVSTVAITGMVVDPALSSALAFAVLNEVPSLNVLLGGALVIIAGVLLHHFQKKRKDPLVH